MQRSERHRLIIRSVDSGVRTVDDLVTLTGASAVSIRRDLVELSEQGALRRIRGGAAPSLSRGARYPFEIRRSADAAEKMMLARTVAGLISPGDSVLIDNGTTALAVAEGLSGLGITVMALSLHAAAALARTPGNEVIVPGGVVGPDDLAFTGPGAAEAVRAMRFDFAILGACAADPETGLTVAGWGDAQVKRAAIECARRVVLVATPDKFERTAAHRFGSLKDLDTIVTTRDVPAEVIFDAREAGATVIVASEELA
ncbi:MULTISPECIES: DeoR/GlpR family DNA-binding transcription regulator [Cryobacterium]|uniref:Lactose phosphotransferase system repressor n=1 Tax=Cryobacterium zongtaii TaxID=1259217 RepID=A0A2S3Z9M6_9MICO|nr:MULTISPECIES: DeoR/GlpR family DNA-binding transcription regulator [Cryobacterium]POH62278.1 DeoR/GlpR transcriptional regulator [Cryobacterium zongtaii]POH66038.1 DeoR/GlpR transcriptional regulator [Cryobacterium zongtaii]TFC46706.1 DeoR/GlpR transcriptional regulator [Cryobacterium sp. TMN-39-2]TFC86359.1 DeoR/GlpR transcriptional regulator [Cryobacterium sp. TMT4-31]